ncbi:MAG: hypothetical protein IPH13_22175 [Planctomycetes bacterium]|nr:hypothetical protein [Planctomycetota bacterium]MCC7173399.1 hypothetical protein [Planctomycetota bacterium]
MLVLLLEGAWIVKHSKLREAIRNCFRLREAGIASALIIVGCYVPEQGSSYLEIGAARTGICVGNAETWNGLRVNYRDTGLKSVRGVNVQLGPPRRADETQIAGIGISLLGNKGDTLFGLIVSPMANEAADLAGLYIGGYNGALHSMSGIGFAPTCCLSNYQMCGFHFGLITAGGAPLITGAIIGVSANGLFDELYSSTQRTVEANDGGSQYGVVMSALFSGAFRDSRGLTMSLGGIGVGQDMVGINVGGLFAGAGRDLSGVTAALGSVGAGREISGFALSGICLSSGLYGVSEADANTVDSNARHRDEWGALTGVAVVGVAARVRHVRGVLASLGYIRADSLAGLSVSTYSHIESISNGISIAAVNRVVRIEGRGMMLGILNNVESNPWWARWMPLVGFSLASSGP